MKPMPTHLRQLVIPACVALLAACNGNSLVEQSRERFSAGDSEGGLARLEQAMKEHPDDREARTNYMRQRDRIITEILAAADSARSAARWNDAALGYERVKRLAPGNARAEAGLSAIAAARRHHAELGEALALWSKGDVTGAEARLRPILAENPNHVGARSLLRRIQEKTAQGPAPTQLVGKSLAQPITLEFRDASLKSVFEVISRTSGINFVFDKDVRGDTPVTIFVKNSGIEEVMKLILVTNQLERKVLNANTVLIYPNTPLKQKDYQELVVRSFYLANADVKQAMSMLKTMTRTKDLFADEKLNLLVMRDTPDAVRMAERLIEGLDLAEPEVMLEVEVLEVARNKLLNLGLQVPDAVGFGALTPNLTNTTITTTGSGTNTTLGGALVPGYTNLRGSLGVPFVSNPAFMLNLHSGADDANILANPRIRVKNHEKAKIHIGERLPVFTTTSTANVGVSASVNYLDVGLKLEVEPSVYLEDEVGIKVGLEVSSVIKEVTGPQSALAYEVGTRTAATTLRLKDGETQVLAGLINDEERSSALRIPGLGDLPMVGRLFSSTKDSKTKTEIVLLITPHVVRNIMRPDATTVNFPGGTESSVGSPPLMLSATAANSLSLSSGIEAPAAVDTAPVPVIAPEGKPNTEAAGAPAASRAAIEVPPQVAGGVDFPVAVSVSGLPGAKGGKAEVAYDPTAVEVPGSAANGRLVMDLLPGPGGTLRGEARVRAIPGSGREVVFQAAEIRVEDAGGNSVFLPPPPPQAVKMAP